MRRVLFSAKARDNRTTEDTRYTEDMLTLNSVFLGLTVVEKSVGSFPPPTQPIWLWSVESTW